MDSIKTLPPSPDSPPTDGEPRPAAVAPQTYRDAMSRFAGAVNLITTNGPAGRRGVTVSAVMSVSDDPPTLAVCLNRNRDENAMFARNRRFAINVLCETHLELARAFAGEDRLSMDERFALGHWTRMKTGAPVLANARIAFDCIVTDVQTVHTHDVVFGEVVATGEAGEGAALVYLDRQYRSV